MHVSNGVIRLSRRVALSFPVLLASSSASAQKAPARTLFVIARSKNANEVHYDIRLLADGQLDRREPVSVYWVLRAEDSRREGLNFFERELAYGFSASRVRADESFTLRLTAFKRRELVVARDAAGRFRASLDIAGRRATLERIFVDTDEGGLTPSVRYVELSGHDAQGARVRERLRP